MAKDKFKKEWFNPLFYYINHYLKDNNIREIYVYGGSSSAKTHSILQALLLDGYYRDYSSIVYRKEQTAIKTTVKNECKSIIENLNLNQIHEFDFEFRYNEKKLQFKGIDKEGKIKGLKGYRKLFFDEIDQFRVEEFNQSKLRLRGEDNQQLLFSWNPVDENHWLKKYLDNFDWIDEPTLYNEKHKQLNENSFIKRCGNKILIKTTYLDNYWVVGSDWGRYDEHVINEFETLKLTNTDLYNVYALGNWGTLRNDNPFFYMLSSIEMNNEDYIPSTQHELLFSFDFNHTPTTCIVAQKRPDLKKVFVFDLILADINTATNRSPIQAVCDIIKRKYGNITPYLYRITGDSSGTQQKSDRMANVNFYTDIIKELAISKSQVTIKNNIKHSLSGDICNSIFSIFGKSYVICGNTKVLQDEIKTAFADADGSLNAFKKASGGHSTDAFRYLNTNLIIKTDGIDYKRDIKFAMQQVTGVFAS